VAGALALGTEHFAAGTPEQAALVLRLGVPVLWWMSLQQGVKKKKEK
jgi:hypothetical protein